MKRLIFCFDGTSNVIEAVHPTNVVNVAASIRDRDRKGIQQVVYYDEGVGSTKAEKLKGGAFGFGLHRNILEAYKFLVLNFQPKDEIFIFGFSRGAFTARSFAGLINYCGILQRCFAEKVFQANWYYQNRNKAGLEEQNQILRFKQFYGVPICTSSADDDWRCHNIPNYKAGDDPRLKIKYIGVWDTVKTLGWSKKSRDHAYHDVDLNESILAGRHAVALDERRDKFDVTLWEKVDAFNAAAGFSTDDPKRPYQQVWFPGVHGAVGGGGDIRGLSDQAFEWVMDGARREGLQLDTSEMSKIFKFQPDALSALRNVTKPAKNFNHYLMKSMKKITRIGPKGMHEVSPSAIIRWAAPAKHLPERAVYRPKALTDLAPQMGQAAEKYKEEDYRRRWTYLAADETLPPSTHFDGKDYGLHRVTGADTLGGIAKQYYGDPLKYKLIAKTNAVMVINPDRIYEGQVLLIPRI